jgi:hypothetical protein
LRKKEGGRVVNTKNGTRGWGGGCVVVGCCFCTLSVFKSTSILNGQGTNRK